MEYLIIALIAAILVMLASQWLLVRKVYKLEHGMSSVLTEIENDIKKLLKQYVVNRLPIKKEGCCNKFKELFLSDK